MGRKLWENVPAYILYVQRSAAQNQAEQEALAQQNEWKEANIDPDDSLHDTDEHLSQWQPTVQDDGTSQATKKARLSAILISAYLNQSNQYTK